ncbi:MAG: hypothetical protein ICV77_18195 [Cyanobacteria bacterium Co-bin8]|nr:hypothetical protein [Cyanobacteria bacterium Co-bin8]
MTADFDNAAFVNHHNAASIANSRAETASRGARRCRKTATAKQDCSDAAQTYEA